MKKQNLLTIMAVTTTLVAGVAISTKVVSQKLSFVNAEPTEHSVTFDKDSEFHNNWLETTDDGNKVEMGVNDDYAMRENHDAGKFFYKAIDNNNYFIFSTNNSSSFPISNIQSVSVNYEILSEIEDNDNTFNISFYKGITYMVGLANSVYDPVSNQAYSPADGDNYTSGASYNCVNIHAYGKIEVEIYSITITYIC